MFLKKLGHAFHSIQISHQTISWVILSGLLILRLPIVAGGITLLDNKSWIDPVYEIGTYLLTAFLIYWERDRLMDFHIDRLALMIIIVFKPIQTLILREWQIKNSLTFPNWPSLVLWVIAIGLLIAILYRPPPMLKLSKNSFSWFGIGIAAGLVTSLLLAFPMSLQIDKSLYFSHQLISEGIKTAPLVFVYQLGFAAVSEEPLFRGFLWGYLQKAGWKEVWIWLFQAGLFTLGHMYYIKTLPISFWILVPLSALLFGGLVWRSKTISSSLAAHATINALTIVFANAIVFLTR